MGYPRSNDTIPNPLRTNLNPTYKLRTHTISPLHLFSRDEKFGIKMYGLESDHAKVNGSLVRQAEMTIENRVSAGQLNVQSKAGFCVISPDCVNLTMWGYKLPSLGHQTVLVPRRFSSARANNIVFEKQQDLTSAGSYCIYESQVLAHESQAWTKYLGSNQTQEDLEKYFQDTFPLTNLLTV